MGRVGTPAVFTKKYLKGQFIPKTSKNYFLFFCKNSEEQIIIFAYKITQFISSFLSNLQTNSFRVKLFSHKLAQVILR